MHWWVHEVYSSLGMVALLSWVFWVLFSITLHELAHGWAAIWEGDSTPIETGHMTGNPVVHMGGFSLIVFALIGVAWGLMPVSPGRFRHRRWGDAIVAAAGPLMNLALAAVCLTTLGLWMRIDPSMPLPAIWAPDGAVSPLVPAFQKNAGLFLAFGGWLNLVLFALNLLPIPPLDGSRILAACSRTIRQLYHHPNAGLAGLVFFFLIVTTNIFDWAFMALNMIADHYVVLIATAGS